jgi:hypothetical protein
MRTSFSLVRERLQADRSSDASMMMAKGTLEIAGGHIDPFACDLIGISESDFQQKSISTSALVVDARLSQAKSTTEGSILIVPRQGLTHPQSGPKT